MHTFFLECFCFLGFFVSINELMVGGISDCHGFNLKWVFAHIFAFMHWAVASQRPRLFYDTYPTFRTRAYVSHRTRTALGERATSKWNNSFLWKVPALLNETRRNRKQIFLGRNRVCSYLARNFRKGKNISSGLRSTFNVKYHCFQKSST